MIDFCYILALAKPNQRIEDKPEIIKSISNKLKKGIRSWKFIQDIACPDCYVGKGPTH